MRVGEISGHGDRGGGGGGEKTHCKNKHNITKKFQSRLPMVQSTETATCTLINK